MENLYRKHFKYSVLICINIAVLTYRNLGASLIFVAQNVTGLVSTCHSLDFDTCRLMTHFELITKAESSASRTGSQSTADVI